MHKTDRRRAVTVPPDAVPGEQRAVEVDTGGGVLAQLSYTVPENAQPGEEFFVYYGPSY